MADPDRKFDADILLADHKAYLVGAVSSESLEDDRELSRGWQRLPNRYLEELEAIVRAKRFRDGFSADQKPYPGRWRIAKVSSQRGKESNEGILTETLRLGLLQTTLPDDEARAGNTSGEPGVLGFKMRRYWPYVDPLYANARIAELRIITSVTTPTADSVEYSGTYAASDVGQQENDDGSILIYQDLTLVSSPATAADLGALQSYEMQGDEILNIFGLKTGTSDVTAFRYPYLNVASKAIIAAFTDADLVTNISGAGWTYSERKWEEEKDNTATLYVAFKKAAWTNTIPDYYVTSRQNVDGYGEQETGWAPGVPVTSAEAKVTAMANTLTDGKAIVAGTFSEKGQGEAVVIKNRRVENTLAVVTELIPQTERGRKQCRKTWYMVPPAKREATIETAQAFKGEGTGYTGLTHGGVTISDLADNWCNITAVAFYPDSSLTITSVARFRDIFNLIHMEPIIITDSDSNNYRWKMRTVTYDVRYFDNKYDAWKWLGTSNPVGKGGIAHKIGTTNPQKVSAYIWEVVRVKSIVEGSQWSEGSTTSISYTSTPTS